MSETEVAPASRRHSVNGPAGSRRYSQNRQIALITAAALAVFLVLRLLPTGTNLSHMDFRVDAKNSIEFCDPLNPQFIPVVAVRSPVTMAIAPASPPTAGREMRGALTLRTASGKPVAAEDLLVAHTRKLHLLIVDPTLTDYQHVHPGPTRTRGEWAFAFTPRTAGAYRVFADFTPVARGQGLYASADLEVVGQVSDLTRPGGPSVTESKSTSPVGDLTHLGAATLRAIERDGYRFTLSPAASALRAGQPIDLAFAVEKVDGGPVPLEPVMGAFAHLVAFDQARSGFAHLHPVETDLTRLPDPARPVLHFKVTIPSPGRYVIWAQVSLGGREVFVPFWFEVAR